MRGLLLVARREILVNGRTKSYLIGLAVMSVLAVGVMLLPLFVGGGDDEYAVAVSGAESEEFSATLSRLAEAADVNVDVEVVDDDADETRRAVEAGDVDAAVADNETLLTEDGTDSELQSLLADAHRQTMVERQLADAGLSSDAVDEALDVTPLSERTLQSDDAVGRHMIAYLVVIVMFFFVLMSSMYVAMGVVEEKSSRIVEILLSSLKAWQLLSGKVLGLGVLGLVNLAVPALILLAAGGAAGTTGTLPEGVAGVIVSALGWWVLGFAFFAAMAGALASLVSRQEEVSSAIGPMTMLMIGCYVLSSIYAFRPAETVAQVLSFVPPFSMMMMPVRAAAGDAPIWQQLLSAGLLAAAAAGMFMLGSAIYRRGVLRTGSRIKLTRVFAKSA
ncbi:MAG: ABC transporter permease [Stackebrandtia sp.]